MFNDRLKMLKGLATPGTPFQLYLRNWLAVRIRQDALDEVANASAAMLRAEAFHRGAKPQRKALWRVMDSLRYEVLPDAGIQTYCKEAAQALNDPYSADEDVLEVVEYVLESGALGDGPFSFETFKAYYRGMTAEQMLSEFSVDDFED